MEMDVFLPTMKSSSPELDTHIDFELFTQVTNLSILSLTTSPLHAEWDFEQQTMSSHDGDYTYIDVSGAPMSENDDSDTPQGFAIFEKHDDNMFVSPVIRSSPITQAEEVEMSKYVDFEYDG
jgi:hypothetical protein